MPAQTETKPANAVSTVLSVPYVVDGDSLWAVLEHPVGHTLGGRQLLERDYAGGTSIRLGDGGPGLNTPEKRKDPEGWRRAREDLSLWIGLRPRTLTFHSYGEGAFGRTLGDLVDATGESVCAWMRSLGWAAYR